MKNILLAVTGLSPQVITETLYALHQGLQEVDAIHVITTREGKESMYAGLLSGKSGQYHRYLKDYGIDPATIDFGHGNIHVIRDEHGNEVSDIADESDNERLLKLCLDLSFRFTKDPDAAVFFSVAGGRKTMSSCLALAAQMYGRPQDRLFHVLVSPEFESNRDFYYPPPIPRRIKLKDGKGQPCYKETRFCEVSLIHMPFISIRDRLSPDMLSEPKDPATMMLSLIRESVPRLTVDMISKKIVFKTVELDMKPAWIALYAFFAMQKKDCPAQKDRCGACTDCFIGMEAIYDRQPEITDLYRKVSGSRPLDEMSDTGIVNLSGENFQAYKGKIKSEILARFGPYALPDLEIAPVGTRPNTRYGIRMEKERIEILY